MRLGGASFDSGDPQKWIASLQRNGFSAAYFPVREAAANGLAQDYVRAAADADILIAEIGVWNNPLSADPQVREAAIRLCQERLALAEEVGARCCVNIAGSRGEQWDGPHPDNLSDETFEMIVEITREIIDAVKPKRTFFTLEAMAWVYPDSPDSYLRLIKAIDRDRFGVHLDPVNWMNCPERYYRNGQFLEECFRKLGAHIKSCHAKDTLMSGKLTLHIDEVRAGLGTLRYDIYLRELAKLDPDTPLMIEHLKTEEEYMLAAEHIRSVAAASGVPLRTA